MTSNICSIDGCSSPVHGRAWCGMHYMRWYRTGSLRAYHPHIRNANPTCSVIDCSKSQYAHTWCHAHYTRVWRHGTLATLRQYHHAEACSIEDCNRAYYGKGLCAAHYQSRIRDPRRRAQKKGAERNDFTTEQWQQKLDESSYRCAYCGTSDENLTQDHVIPLSRGGNHTASNIVPACGSCNSKKSNRLLEQWLEEDSYFYTIS